MSADLAVHDLVWLSRIRIGAGPNARVRELIREIGVAGRPDPAG